MPRSQSLALARRSDAVCLFRQGRTFEQIANSVGFANRGTAHRVVRKAFESRIVEDIDLHRQFELERLDAVQAAVWDPMVAGDIGAANVILKIIHERAQLLGLLDHPPRVQQMLIQPGGGNTGKATPLLKSA